MLFRLVLWMLSSYSFSYVGAHVASTDIVFCSGASVVGAG
jgi:hypothetical protein